MICLNNDAISVTQELLDLTRWGLPADDTLERRLQAYLRPDLLVLDDFGLKALHPPAPEDFYDIINERYERGRILLTGNRPPEECPDLFGDPLLASAGLDRLTHNAAVVVITGASFRSHGSRPKEEAPIEQHG